MQPTFVTMVKALGGQAGREDLTPDGNLCELVFDDLPVTLHYLEATDDVLVYCVVGLMAGLVSLQRVMRYLSPVFDLGTSEHSECNMRRERLENGTIRLTLQTPSTLKGDQRAVYEIGLDGVGRMTDLRVAATRE